MTFALVAFFLLARFDFATGQTILSHPDVLGTLNNLHTFDLLIKDFTFLDYLNAWNPLRNGGQPLLPPHHPNFYLYWLINSIDPFKVSLAVVHNYLALHYLILFSIGMLLLCFELTQDRKSAVVGFSLCLFGNLALVAYWQEVPRWMFLKPYVFLCFLRWLKYKRPTYFIAGMSLLGVLATQYLLNGVLVVALAVLGTYAFLNLRDTSRLLKQQFTLKRNRYAFLFGSLLFAFAVSPVLFMYSKTLPYVDGGRGFNGFYEDPAQKNKKTDIISIVNNSHTSDFLTFATNAPLSSHLHAWNYSGPLLLTLALIGLATGVLVRSSLTIGLGLSVVLLSVFSMNAQLFFSAFPVLNLLRSGIYLLNDISLVLVVLAAFGFRAISKKESGKWNPPERWGVFFGVAAIIFTALVTYTQKNLRDTYIMFLFPNAIFAITILIRHPFFSIRKVFASSLIITLIFFIFTHWQEIASRGDEMRNGSILSISKKIPEGEYPRFSYPVTRTTLIRQFSKYDFQQGTASLFSSQCPSYAGMMPGPFARLVLLAYPFYSRYCIGEPQNRYAIFAGGDFPIFFLTNHILIRNVADDDALRDMIHTYNSSTVRPVYFFETPPPFPANEKSTEAIFRLLKKTTLREYSPRKLTLEVDSETDAFLVRLENYDSDWKAEVNGNKTEIIKANYAFQAIPLPKGKSTVVLTYQSTYLWWFGLHLLAFAIGGTLMVLEASLRPTHNSDIHRFAPE